MLNFSGIHKKFDKEILSNINLNVREGEFLSILGPSGSGKSTILRLASKILEPSKGKVEYKKSKSPVIGFVFQEPTLMPWRNVLNNVLLPLELNEDINKSSIDTAKEWLKNVGLSGKENSFPNELSGGQKMRVSIARALVQGCDLLLLDEPFAALDEITRNKLENDLLSIWEKERFTVLFVTHSVSEAIYLSERIIVLSNNPGQIIYEENIDYSGSRKEFQESNQYQEINNHIFKRLEEGMENE